ncbi:putative COP9 signalosome subunit 5 CSN5 [Sistotremastrum niveocremeum HHB9708]|uniref:COP9 signalosome complex subunit 5 n=2 Tax=Sistotremastraceae TaxID=3402574 RepID=A0A165ALX1_9AGAM|nr:putative COP9 signalosome subunit 5 CSN5 [Sistotremastrum niveocremeum HHB9708]KZT42070.1 putative COP9 signalosome subunit 5 CSN5 [Sistotremastrum suecicum HHB10207 ss-3]
MSTTALKSFSLLNDIQTISPQDEIFKYDQEKDAQINREAPWSKDPHYFTSCKISAVALIKMVIHARSGVPYEIMGLMRGKVVDRTIVIIDSFALPVQGTETRVNAGDQATEYMVQFLEGSRQAGMPENAVGWYHSHPGYGCWLSGIDVATESMNQKMQDPFVAVVVDPVRTISAGKVDIGAFRTYPDDYKPPNASASEYQYIPQDKIEEFGVHANAYYPLEVSVFKSSLDDHLLDLLWNKYWANTLSSSPLISNRAYAASQLADIHAKLQKTQSSLSTSRDQVTQKIRDSMKDIKESGPSAKGKEKESDPKRSEETALSKAILDSAKIASDAQHGLISQVLKDIIFGNKAVSAQSQVTEVLETTMADP